MSISCDYLVIGSGIAGLSFALKTAAHGSVAVITKREIDESATRYAQGGIASVFSTEDSFDAHVQDTLVAGADICHEEVVRMVVEEGPQTIRDLINWGVKFTEVEQGELMTLPAREDIVPVGFSMLKISPGVKLSARLLKRSKTIPT